MLEVFRFIKDNKEIRNKYISLIIKLAIFVVLFSLINRFIISLNYISSGSMETTLMTGDIALSTQIFKDIDRYDIVTFNMYEEDTDEESIFIKRVIGLPGDTVEILNANVYVNGELIKNEFVNISLDGECNIGYKKFVVPDNNYFVMGDNRNNSYDSRYWESAFVAREDIISIAKAVILPIEHIHIVK